MGRFGLRVAIVAASLSFCANAQAAIVLDQNALVSPTATKPTAVTTRIGEVIRPNQPIMQISGLQTVTAGVAGTLDRIDVQIARGFGDGLLQLFLFDGDPFTGAATTLVTLDIGAALLPTLTGALNQTSLASFDVSIASFVVTSGQQFSFGLQFIPLQTGAFASAIIGTGPQGPIQNPVFAYNAYGGGAFRTVANFSPPGTVANGDIGFRTYVNQATAAVPEPATWAMMILGFGVLGTAMRRQRRYRLSGRFG